MLRAFPSLPTTLIGERIGWTRSIQALSGRVADLRAAYLPPDPASRTSHAAGEIAQRDFWLPDIGLPSAKAGPDGEATAGADDGVRLFQVALGGAGALPRARGPGRGLVAADRGA